MESGKKDIFLQFVPKSVAMAERSVFRERGMIR